MKNLILFLVPVLSFNNSIFSQTYVSGTLTTNTSWTIANSPYILTGTVGVFPGVILQIDSGVQISGNFDLLVKGDIIAYGSATSLIGVTNTRIIFKSANLSNSHIAYLSFNGGGIQLAEESQNNQDSPKNSGTLTVSNCTYTNHAYARTKGYATMASMVINNSTFTNSAIRGYPLSEPIALNSCSITSDSIVSGAYNYGIYINSSTCDNCIFLIGCCSAKINITNSNISLSSFSANNDSSPSTNGLTISNCTLSNSTINMPISIDSLINSTFNFDNSNAANTKLIISRGLIDSCTFSGSNGKTCIQKGSATSGNTGALTIVRTNFLNFDIAVKIMDQGTSGSIKTNNCNFINSLSYNYYNQSPKNIDATFNYWGSDSVNIINSKIYDMYDDLNLGLVDFSNRFSSSTIPTAILNNTITGVQTVCSGMTPQVLIGSTPAGGIGLFSYAYTWLRSTIGPNSGFTPAGGTNNTQNYSPSALSVNTWYRRLVISGGVYDTSLAIAITVNPKPVVGFSVNSLSQCLYKQNFIFNDTSKISSGTIIRNWVFGDNSASSDSAIVSKSFSALGSYAVKLVSISNHNCRDSVSKTVTVNSQPIATISASGPISFCQGGSVGLNASNGTGLTYVWLNNDTIIPGANTSSYSSAASGYYQVIVTNAFGCSSKSGPVIVTVNPLPLIGPMSGKTSSNTNDTANYTVALQSGLTYSWLVTNGTIQSGQGTNAINVRWTAKGTGTVKAVVLNSGSCRDSVELNVSLLNTVVNETSLGDFSIYPNPVKDELIISGTNQSFKNSKLIISDLFGRKITEENIPETTNQFSVPVSWLKNGVYFLIITSGDEINRLKFVKQ